MNRNYMLGGCAALMLLGVAAWGLGWFTDGKYSGDPVVAELQKLRDERFAGQAQMSETDQQVVRTDFRERMQGLSDEQRQAFFESSAPFFMKMMEQQIDRFLAMPPEEQRKQMDQRLDEMQARGGGPPGGGPGGDRSPAQFDQMRKRMLDASSPQQRAKIERAMEVFQQRAKERGMNPGQGGGFF